MKPTLFNLDATIIEKGTDEKGRFIITDITNAYPQGGGQEADHGLIISAGDDYFFNDVRYSEGSVKHYLQNGWEWLEKGSKIEIAVDHNRRQRNSILHTSGHLIASVAFKIMPELTHMA